MLTYIFFDNNPICKKNNLTMAAGKDRKSGSRVKLKSGNSAEPRYRLKQYLTLKPDFPVCTGSECKIVIIATESGIAGKL